MTGDRPRLLAVGDGVVPTGFARVLHSVLGRLQDRWEIHHLAINYDGSPHTFGWPVYPAASESDYWGAGRLRELVEQVRPEIVLLLNDPWVLGSYVDALREVPDEVRRAMRVVAYAPVDAGPLDPGLMAPLAGLDRLVLYTEFGRREVERSFDLLRRERPDLRFPRLDVVPHGVDTDVFRPWPAENGTPGRLLARQRLLPAELHDSFIVLNANRNQPRKRIDLTLKGFARFAEDKPENVRLYLHMGVEDCGWNVIALARRFGIADRLILTAEERLLPAVADNVLDRIYNACDVGINTSVGEGWGLVNLEHAATGAAQVVPRHSACAEIWDGAAMLMEPSVSLTTEQILTEGLLVSPEEVARALEALYRDPDLLAAMSAAARHVATRPEYQWAQVAERWDELLREALGEPPALDTDSTC
jgi:D-inositol-3-phosphate glycosyltransferase